MDDKSWQHPRTDQNLSSLYHYLTTVKKWSTKIKRSSRQLKKSLNTSTQVSIYLAKCFLRPFLVTLFGSIAMICIVKIKDN